MKKINKVLLTAFVVLMSMAVLFVTCGAETSEIDSEGWALVSGNEDGVNNDFKWQVDSEGTLSFYNAGTLNSTELKIDNGNENAPNGWGSSHPWNDHRKNIKKIILPSTVESIAGWGMFGNLPNLETVVINSEKITVHAACCAFMNCPKLTTMGPEGTPVGTYDIKNIVWRSGYSSNCAASDHSFFEGCGAGVDITVLLPVTEFPCFPYSWSGVVAFREFDWNTAKSVTFKYIPGSEAEKTADAYIAGAPDLFKKSSYGAGEITIGGTGSCVREDTNSTYDWKFDVVSGVLSFTRTGGTRVKPFSTRENTVLSEIKSAYSDVVTKIELSGFGELTEWWGSPLAGWPNLEAVDIGNAVTYVTGSGGGLFKNNPKLTTVGSSYFGTYEEGVVNISTLTGMRESSSEIHFNKMFMGCSAITKVILPTNVSGGSIVSNGLFDKQFENCTSLKEIVVPVSYKFVQGTPLTGCTGLERITVLSSSVLNIAEGAIPDQAGLTIACLTDGNKALLEGKNFVNTDIVGFDGAIDLTGFSVRVKDYNGLRTFFNFDILAKSDYEAAGLTLVEYGAMAASKETYSLGGTALVKNGNTYVPALEKVSKVAIWSGGDWAEGAKILYTSSDESVDFALSVVKFTDNYDKDMYICGYSVWIDSDGTEYIVYEDYSGKNPDYKFVNLRDMCIAIYNGTDSYAAVTNSNIINEILVTVGYLKPDGSKNEDYEG